MSWFKKKEPKRKGGIYRFDPQPDITTFELATIIQHLRFSRFGYKIYVSGTDENKFKEFGIERHFPFLKDWYD